MQNPAIPAQEREEAAQGPTSPPPGRGGPVFSFTAPLWPASHINRPVVRPGHPDLEEALARFLDHNFYRSEHPTNPTPSPEMSGFYYSAATKSAVQCVGHSINGFSVSPRGEPVPPYVVAQTTNTAVLANLRRQFADTHRANASFFATVRENLEWACSRLPGVTASVVLYSPTEIFIQVHFAQVRLKSDTRLRLNWLTKLFYEEGLVLKDLVFEALAPAPWASTSGRSVPHSWKLHRGSRYLPEWASNTLHPHYHGTQMCTGHGSQAVGALASPGAFLPAIQRSKEDTLFKLNALKVWAESYSSYGGPYYNYPSMFSDTYTYEYTMVDYAEKAKRVADFVFPRNWNIVIRESDQGGIRACRVEHRGVTEALINELAPPGFLDVSSSSLTPTLNALHAADTLRARAANRKLYVFGKGLMALDGLDSLDLGTQGSLDIQRLINAYQNYIQLPVVQSEPLF